MTDFHSIDPSKAKLQKTGLNSQGKHQGSQASDDEAPSEQPAAAQSRAIDPKTVLDQLAAQGNYNLANVEYKTIEQAMGTFLDHFPSQEVYTRKFKEFENQVRVEFGNLPLDAVQEMFDNAYIGLPMVVSKA